MSERGSEAPDDGRRRVAVEGLSPVVDGGRFAVKRVVGDVIAVEADVFADGHDLVACALVLRRDDGCSWREVPMTPLGNDRFRGQLALDELGLHRFAVEGWIDAFGSWRRDLVARVAAKQDVHVELLVGARLVSQAASRAQGADADALSRFAEALATKDGVTAATDELLGHLMARHADRRWATRSPEMPLVVDPPRARFSSWYELFPRSCSPEPGRHGTLADVQRLLPEVAAMGFDVLYLPPIHPIGRVNRKGPNNSPTSKPGDVGSPWAIGAAEGGHDAIHPDLGTLDDFRRLVASARSLGVEVAMDVAFQCAPDHPWVMQHPEWFRHLPDGTIRPAENPPKKYQDVYPFDFEGESWRELWSALVGVVRYWVEQGVRIFRVDNPHTKPLPLWERLIGETKKDHPEVVFLSEAFTRPKVMYRLAKLGFTQSYTYFTWRTTRDEIARYFTELTRSEVREFFRPNLWPNTPDILPEHLQHGGRPAFAARAVLAATLGASWGIYGPAFELCEARPVAPGAEEYLDSEKYEVKRWDRASPGSLRGLITRLNAIRREHRALQSDHSLAFHQGDNDRIVAYTKATDDGAEVLLVVVNLDPHHAQAGWIDLDLPSIGRDEAFQVHDLLTDARFLWCGRHNRVELDPRGIPAQVLRIRKRVRSERDFDYYL